MIAKIKLTQTVTCFVKADSEDAITDWYNTTTPEEAIEQAKASGSDPSVEYTEELVCYVDENSYPDITLD